MNQASTNAHQVPRLFSNKWLRRGLLIIIGFLLAIIYIGSWSEDVIATPFVLGLVIGFLSDRALDAYINSAIVLISEIGLILVHAIAGDVGSLANGGAAGNVSLHLSVADRYMGIIVLALSNYSVEFVTWIPGVALGLLLRRLTVKSSQN